MGKIQVLSPALASQIAAGEVVERPASALKELLENSLDAGASRCDVEIEGGGVTRLCLKDDGAGMSPEDAALSVERHATSKLTRFEQLHELSSFGFRGEALPTISSVSRFTLRTRSRDHETGTEIHVAGGQAARVRPIGMAVGTSVEVVDLFYNVPARRKFLRASGTESGHVADVVEAAALARPEVTFTLMRDGRKAREWLRVRDRAERVAKVLTGEELARCAGERGPLQVEAFLSRPERSRAGANALRLLCNGRPIRDRALLHAVARAYGSVLERGRYPRGVIYLDLPSRLVDVNVHPQKAEVRFADAQAVCDAVYQILSKQLGQVFGFPAAAGSLGAPSPASGRAPGSPGATTPAPAVMRGARAPEDASEQPAAVSGGAAEGGVFDPRLSDAPPPRSASAAYADSQHRDAAWRASDHPRVPRLPYLPSRERASSERQMELPAQSAQGLQLADARGAGSALSGSDDSSSRVTSSSTAPSAPLAAPVRAPERAADVRWSRLRLVGQARACYWICEGDEGLFVLDQHAAAERVTFHRIREQYRAQTVASQALLFPSTVRLSVSETELLERLASTIERLGFELRVHSETTVSVHRVPQLLGSASPERLVRDLLDELDAAGRQFSGAVDKVLATMACHASVRAGERMTDEEARALLSALDQVDFSGHCPHGRPIVMFTPWPELERKVGRR